MHGNRSGSCSHSTSVQPYWFHYSYCVYIKTTQYLLILAATFCPVKTILLEKACSMVRQLFCSVYWYRITSSYRTIYWKPRIIFLKRPAFHSEHFRFSEHKKRKDQNNLKPHYKIAPKGAGLPYQICENSLLISINTAKAKTCHKVCKCPNMLTCYEIAGIHCFIIFFEICYLIFLWENYLWKLMHSGDRISAILCNTDLTQRQATGVPLAEF